MHSCSAAEHDVIEVSWSAAVALEHGLLRSLA
jgi:hypothetical protein